MQKMKPEVLEKARKRYERYFQGGVSVPFG